MPFIFVFINLFLNYHWQMILLPEKLSSLMLVPIVFFIKLLPHFSLTIKIVLYDWKTITNSLFNPYNIYINITSVP